MGLISYIQDFFALVRYDLKGGGIDLDDLQFRDPPPFYVCIVAPEGQLREEADWCRAQGFFTPVTDPAFFELVAKAKYRAMYVVGDSPVPEGLDIPVVHSRIELLQRVVDPRTVVWLGESALKGR